MENYIYIFGGLQFATLVYLIGLGFKAGQWKGEMTTSLKHLSDKFHNLPCIKNPGDYFKGVIK